MADHVIDEYAVYANEHQEVERVRRFECFTPAPLPADIQRGEQGRCSVTTLKLAAQLGLVPVRGYALFRRDDRLRPVWIGHWWALKPDGTVVDASWEEPALAYIGERIALLKERSARGGYDLSAHTLEGSLIIDLGVYVYPPLSVTKELERMRASFVSGP